MPQDTKTVLTAEEFAALPDNGVRCELVRGEVIEMTPASAESGRVSMRIGLRVAAFVEARGAGATYTAEAGFVLARDPDCVRAPDIAFVAKGRLPGTLAPEGFFPSAPDLAVEVVSPTDRGSDIEEKVAEYLEAGTRLVWVVYPDLRRVRVYRAPSESFTVGEGGTLSGDPVLPGLAIPVTDIFAR
jgi:Uma2 family endonuclease